ncbi:SpoIIE family protein phosphatase [Carbonactinospora thermoautotrophica]|uniref:SpoIIE family protein phosphatase n=1 Tax=Carbonactinospora thermoautotrophica TaxID=1469144 RepID=UPI00226F05F2|nr:SpoIIE family protein phosphatase [Carbonactinospora thermoautotrophica]
MTFTITAQAHATFEPESRSVAEARRFVRKTLTEWGALDAVDDAVLLVSELVTNAVVHAGTRTDVTCLRYEGGIQIEVEDRYPARELPLYIPEQDSGHEGGRGLYLSAMVASAWGVDYSRTSKRVWFRLDLPTITDGGTIVASPVGLGRPLPSVTGELRVAVVRADADGRVREWNADAEALFGWTGQQARQLKLGELISWPHRPGGVLTLVDVLQLSRWQGEYGVRHRDGRVVPVFASHVQTLADGDDPSIVCLMVLEEHRSVLEVPAPVRSEAVEVVQPVDPVSAEWAGLSESVTARLGLDELLQRTVERARDSLGGDAAYILLTTEDEGEMEVRATTGLPQNLHRGTRLLAEGSTGRVFSARLPAVHDDLGEGAPAVSLLRGTGMRSLLTVPLMVEGRVIGQLGVASEQPGRFDNEDAIRLQRAADRIALSVESARLAELERIRRGWLSFLAEASDLLAGTLHHEMTLAMVAQLVVPRLATWCAVYTVDETETPRLSYVWHADEEMIDPLRDLLEQAPLPKGPTTPGAARWTCLAEVPDDAVEFPPDVDLRKDHVIALPLVARGHNLGMLVLGRPARDPFHRDVVDLAEDLSRRAALALDNARLYSDRAATSHQLQQSLLPSDLPEVPSVDVGVVYQAAGEGNEVGGDFYDLFAIDGERFGFAIGDVCGKGAGAAAVTGLARHALRILAREGHDVSAVLERLNKEILGEGARARFLTLLYGEIRPRGRGRVELRFASAGHPLPMLLRSNGELDTVGTEQPLLGVLDELDLKVDEVTLRAGDVLVCFTDGVTERRRDRQMLGEDGLARVLADCVSLNAGAVAVRVQRAVVSFAPDAPRDDMAVMVLRATPGDLPVRTPLRSNGSSYQ